MNHPLPPCSRFFKVWPDGQWVFTFQTPSAKYEIPVQDLAGDALMFARAIAYSFYMDEYKKWRTLHKHKKTTPGFTVERLKIERDLCLHAADEWHSYQPHQERTDAPR